MKKEIPYLHVARVAGCLAVVLIHTISSNVASLGHVPMYEWWLNSIIDAAVVWAVPLFIMISGALLLGKKETPETFYRKRIMSTLLPAVTWTVITYYLFAVIRGIPTAPSVFVKSLIFDQPFENLYFLFIILELYVLTPFLRSVVQQLADSQVFGLSLLFIFIGIFWTYQQFLFTMFIPYLGYFYLGYFLHTRFGKLKNRKLLYASFIINTAVISIGTYLFASHTVYNFGDDFYFYRHTNVFVILLTVTTFLLFRELNTMIMKHNFLYTLIRYISGATLGIYILHWPLRVVLFYVLFGTKDIIKPFPFLYQPVLFLFLFVTSLLMTKLLQQIPLIKRII